VLYRFDAPLFFANADFFRERVRALARSGDANWIVVAAEPMTDIDATAGETLRSLNDELQAAGIELAFAEPQGPGARLAEPLWHRRRDRQSPILPHHRRGRRHLPRRDQDRLA
jgi:MFS superfamily sulfate permease-like transporter